MVSPTTRSLLLAGCAAASLSSAAMATTRNSFLDVGSINGITVVTSNAGRDYSVTLDGAANFMLGNTSYPITRVIGFYLLSDDVDFNPLPALANVGPPGLFVDDSSNSGTGAIAGWKSNPNNGFVLGQSLTFSLPANFPVALIDRIGFHIFSSGNFPGTSGNTGNITGTLVPTPSAAALLALAGVGVARRRRR